MNRPHASIIYSDETQVIVQCPYCDMFHKHGATITTGESRSSDCNKGEYTLSSNCQKGDYFLGDVISPKDIKIAIKRRNADLERKRKKGVLVLDSGDEK